MKAGKERKGGTEKGEGSKAKRDKDARGGDCSQVWTQCNEL